MGTENVVKKLRSLAENVLRGFFHFPSIMPYRSTVEWFEESKDIIGGIAYPAIKFGRVIYEAA